MIPSYLADLNLPAVFAAYTNTPCNFLQESTKNEHIVDSASSKTTSSQMNYKVRFLFQNGIPLSFARKKVL